MSESNFNMEHVGNMPTFGGSTRREFLRRSAILGVSLGSFGLMAARPVSALAATSSRDYATRAVFDELDRYFEESDNLGQANDFNEDRGALAWGQSYVLDAYGLMYEAYRDTYYIDKLIDHIDQVLATRDSVRGVTDYRGLSLPAWRAAGPYTVGKVALKDTEGQPILEVRSARAYADTASVTVTDGSTAGTFKLAVYNGQYDRTDTFDNLTMDPNSPNYAWQRIYDAYPSFDMVTSKDLRSVPDAGDEPARGTFELVSQPAIFAVHTGMITYGIARFVRLVYETPNLRRNSPYKAKADEYLQAVEAAVAVHDREWRENDLGEGYYVWPKGIPIPFDGTEQPINQAVALGRTMAQVAAVTDNPTYRDRVEKLARMFRNQLSLDDGGAYIWHYWPTFSSVYKGYQKTGSPATDISLYTPAYGSPSGGAQQIEDISHGHIEVYFAVRAFRDHVDSQVFNGRDMVRLAKTFTQNVLTTNPDGSPTVYVRVDGSGGTGQDDLLSPGWMPLAFWGEDIFNGPRAIYNNKQPYGSSGYVLFEAANLNWYAQLGA